MTPQEKAKELVFKFDDTMEFSTPQRFAKKCALVAVDEILKDKEIIDGMRVINDPYWQQVKQELEKL